MLVGTFWLFIDLGTPISHHCIIVLANMLRCTRWNMSSKATGDAASSDTAARAGRSVANDTPIPHRNPFAVKFAEFYMTKVPTGVREFGLIGPLLLVTFIAVYNMDYWVSDGLRVAMGKGGTMGGDPTTQAKDMLTYRLDPVYDDHGKLMAYRRVSIAPTTSSSAK